MFIFTFPRLFRADFIIGGFVVKELNLDPPSCLVTYITRVDLKGKLILRCFMLIFQNYSQVQQRLYSNVNWITTEKYHRHFAWFVCCINLVFTHACPYPASRGPSIFLSKGLCSQGTLSPVLSRFLATHISDIYYPAAYCLQFGSSVICSH